MVDVFRRMVLLVVAAMCSSAIAADPAPDCLSGTSLATGDFKWTTGLPLVSPTTINGETWHSIKDPSIVRHDGKWHLFCTVRGTTRSHSTVYLSFADWKDAATSDQHELTCHEGYFCAPQVFYFTPHKKWYLICQAADDAWEPHYQPVFATTVDIADPTSWSRFTPLYGYKPSNLKGWIDFWTICDDRNAFLFFTSNDGKMWHSQTPLDQFPKGWSEPKLCLQGDIFEASHTYKLKGCNQYLTLVEAEHGHGFRYYKAYLADRLDGEWRPLAATKDKAFASLKNVEQTPEHWTDAISHGELLRAGFDEQLEVDPHDLRFLYQGVAEADAKGKAYGDIPWRLGILEAAPGEEQSRR